MAKGVLAGFKYVFETRSGSAEGVVDASGAGTGDAADLITAGDLTKINEFTRHQAYFTVDLKY